MLNRLNEETPFDVFSDVMETLRFRGSIFFRSELAAPWGMSLGSTASPRFHILLSGSCFVGVSGEDGIEVRDSEIVMYSGNDAHWIADQPGRPLVPSSDASKACQLSNPLFQQGEITHRIMCGLVHFDRDASHPFIDALPEILHIPRLGRTDPLWMTIQLIDTEIQRGKDPNGPIIDRLTEVLFLQLLNHYISTHQEPAGFLSALSDRRVYQTLKLIHQAPGHNWTQESLGAQVGMSRATLSRKFQEAVGMGPIAYLTKWRIMKAHSLAKYTAEPLEQIADSVGFSSARALGKAFKRHYGCTPQKLRRHGSCAEPEEL
ncbi:MAG: AraC family transcriptional regulator [Halopseudomonas sp.]